ncbi:MAG: universal stress protein [Burkholderiaceae bacterium]|jgi:nucleotide-binding universal stress UspA family protein|nr:universal stress protein [Burkholderiaceae bacterium]
MFKKILIPTDGSVLSNQAAAAGIALAKQLGAEVVGIFVARKDQDPAFDFSGLALESATSPAEYKKIVAAAGNNLMKPLRDAAEKAGVKFSKLIKISNAPADQIVKAAEENECDMIFICSHGSAGWASILLGSVAAKVMALSQVPVTIYKIKKTQLPKKAKINIGFLPV